MEFSELKKGQDVWRLIPPYQFIHGTVSTLAGSCVGVEFGIKGSIHSSFSYGIARHELAADTMEAFVILKREQDMIDAAFKRHHWRKGEFADMPERFKRDMPESNRQSGLADD